MTKSLLRTLISEMVETYLEESENVYDHHAVVVKLPDGNHAILATARKLEDAIKVAHDEGSIKYHKNKPIEHYRITKWGHRAYHGAGYDHDDKKSYDHKRWKFDTENKTVTHDSDKEW